MQDIKVGDCFTVKPEFAKSRDGSGRQKGTVVWLHPAGRFAVLQFQGIHGNPRECFRLEELKK